MLERLRAGLVPALVVAVCGAGRAHAAADTSRVVVDDTRYGLVVSSTRTLKDAVDVPASIDVVKGEVLRRRGARTLADALQDVTGLDLADGSDQGSRMPNIGVWGLKEFDALLVSVDGIPVGGPFNPALDEVPIEDVDRIEITRGPQGTLYGLSAFAGMVQVFTRRSEAPGVEVHQSVGSYDGVEGGFGWNGALAGGTTARVNGSASRGDGWQDRTDFTRFRSSMTFARPIGRGAATLQLIGLQDRQGFGTPVPVDQGEIVRGFDPRRNDAVLGARVDHLVFGATGSLTWPLGATTRLESSLGVTSDRQDLVRNFVDPETLAADSVDSRGQRLHPVETTFYADSRVVHTMELAGAHEWVGGAALTVGKLRVAGDEFDLRIGGLPVPDPPSSGSLAAIEPIEAEDMRTLFGLFLHDSWSPHERLQVNFGGRVDLAGEELEGENEATRTVTKESREDTGWSADGGLLLRLLPGAAPGGRAANLFANVRRNFKPAAPNVFEPAEGLEILDPETSVAFEGGLKLRGFDGQASLEASVFQMELENQVIPVDVNGGPALVNAGKTRFRGGEVTIRLAPAALPGLSLAGGVAHHDPKFVRFTRPDGSSVDGRQVELAPKALWNLSASWQGPRGFSLWGAARGAGERPYNRSNTFFAGSYSEVDAGVGLEIGAWSLGASGRNLGDSRHAVSESELGDSQFYFSAPRRFSAQVGIRM